MEVCASCSKPSGGGVAGAPAGIKDNLANKFQRGPDIGKTLI